MTGAQPRNTNVQIANQVQPLVRQTVARNSDAAAAPTALGTKATKKKDKVPEKVNSSVVMLLDIFQMIVLPNSAFSVSR
jgi:hypothetical protein